MTIVSETTGETGDVQCQYPGCTRPAAPREGARGRRPLFCGQRDGEGPVHIRQNALAEIRRQEAAAQETMRRAGIEARTPAEAQQSAPVDLARATAGVLLEQWQATASDLAAASDRILAQLATASDPAVLETQLQAATTQARAEVATARALQAAAQQDAHAANVRADAAAAIAEAADQAATDAEEARAGAAE